jgi:hypothetical protein
VFVNAEFNLPNICKIHSLRLIVSENRPEGLIRQRKKKYRSHSQEITWCTSVQSCYWFCGIQGRFQSILRPVRNFCGAPLPPCIYRIFFSIRRLRWNLREHYTWHMKLSIIKVIKATEKSWCETNAHKRTWIIYEINHDGVKDATWSRGFAHLK